MERSTMPKPEPEHLARLSQTIAQAFTLPLAVTVYVANGKHELTKAARNIGIAIPR